MISAIQPKLQRPIALEGVDVPPLRIPTSIYYSKSLVDNDQA